MNNEQLLLIGVVCILVVVMGIVVLLIQKGNEKMHDKMEKQLLENEVKHQQQIQQMQQQLTEQLYQFQNHVSTSLKSDMNYLNENTSRHLSMMRQNVHEGLVSGFNKTQEAFSQVMQEMGRMDEAQKNLRQLSENIVSLQSILTDKKARGTFGEVQLYSIMETQFGDDTHFYEKQVKLSNGSIADCVLYAPQPLGKIVIDSKFPLENYNRYVSAGKEEAKVVANEFKRNVLKHIHDIHDKYLTVEETADMAYMFIPAEAVFATIYSQFDEIVQESYKYKVYLVSPTTLMAYLTAIQAIYLDQKRNEKVKDIQQEFIRLSKEFERYHQRFEAVQRDFIKTGKDFDAVSITSEKILKRFRQIEAVELNEVKGEDDEEI